MRIAALLCLLALAAPVPARAHGHLRSSAPAAGAHLGAVPRELRLTFSEAPALAFTRVELLDPTGAPVALGELAVAAGARATVTTAIRGVMTAGTYTVAWQMAGDDGHVTRGRFRFTVAPGAQGTAPPPGTPNATAPPPSTHHSAVSMPEGPGFGAESPLYAVVRWLQFVGLVAVVGAVAFALVVLPRAAVAPPLADGMRERAARLALWATGVVLLGAVLRLLAQSYSMHGRAQLLDAGLVGAMLARTVWGWGWLLEVVAVVAASVGFALATGGARTGWRLAALGAIALAVTPALSGHAASAPRLPGLAIAADALHVLGAGGWLGSLLFVVAAGVPVALRETGVERDAAVAAVVGAFSPTALAFAALATATGVVAAWLHLDALGDLWRSDYGRTLLLKLGALAIVIAAGAYNWLRVRPMLGDPRATARLRRPVTVELLGAALVLAITAVLVATAPPDEAAAPAVAHLTGTPP